jgi:hypothetical protein
MDEGVKLTSFIGKKKTGLRRGPLSIDPTLMCGSETATGIGNNKSHQSHRQQEWPLARQRSLILRSSSGPDGHDNDRSENTRDKVAQVPRTPHTVAVWAGML